MNNAFSFSIAFSLQGKIDVLSKTVEARSQEQAQANLSKQLANLLPSGAKVLKIELQEEFPS